MQCGKCRTEAYYQELVLGKRGVKEWHCRMCGWIKPIALRDGGSAWLTPCSPWEARDRVAFEGIHVKGAGKQLPGTPSAKEHHKMMRERFELGDTLGEIAKEFGVSTFTVRKVIKRSREGLWDGLEDAGD